MDPRSFSRIVLFEDNHLLVCGKPAGIAVQNEGKTKDSLRDRARDYLNAGRPVPGNPWLGMVHRLDQSTSGVVIFCKNSKSAGRISAQFRDRRVTKSYLAVLEGRWKGRRNKLVHDLVRSGRRSGVVPPGHPGSRRAELHCAVLRQNRCFTLVRIRLVTGFYHQIRCQFSHEGHPVWGDRKYGSRKQAGRGCILLHAFRVRFEHPVKKRALDVQAALPESWMEFVFPGRSPSPRFPARCREREYFQSFARSTEPE